MIRFQPLVEVVGLMLPICAGVVRFGSHAVLGAYCTSGANRMRLRMPLTAAFVKLRSTTICGYLQGMLNVQLISGPACLVMHSNSA